MCVREFMFYYFIYWCFIIFVLLLLEQIVCVYVCVCVVCEFLFYYFICPGLKKILVH